jgi:uncharacterized membrane protein YhaH (DUF805 family)
MKSLSASTEIDVMDWQTLFLSVNGRMGQKDYWVGVGILFVLGLVLSNVPIARNLWPLASIYFAVCVYGKRLHDIGQSAWMVMVPFGIMLASFVLAFVIGGAAFMGAVSSSSSDTGAVLGGLAGLGVASILVLVAAVSVIGWIIWLGTRPSDPLDNQFGPPRSVPLVTAI